MTRHYNHRPIAIVKTVKVHNGHDIHEHSHTLKDKAKELILHPGIEGSISKSQEDGIKAEIHYKSKANPEEFNAYNPWLDQDGYQEYIAENGHHFNRKLAVWAINRMENDDGSDYHRMPEAVKAMWNKNNKVLPEGSTWGDATYAYNMAYADFHPDPLKTEDEVLIQSYKDVIDKDGYPEKIFNRWLSDIVYKRISVPWKDMM